MSWLKKQQPIQLYQSSDVPYVILEDGIHLCYDNCYGIKPDKLEHNINFRTSSSNLKRLNTYFYKFSSFPVIIPFEDIISLDNIVIEGQPINRFTESSSDIKSIALVNSRFIKNVPDSTEFSDVLEDFNHRFILVGEYIEPHVRLFNDIATIMEHTEWNKTMTVIAHNVCKHKGRKYCWTKSVPGLSFDYYGSSGLDEMEEINDAIQNVGILNSNVNWATLD